MQSNHAKALKKLKELEAKAEMLESQAQQLEAQQAGFRNECHKTRCLLEGDVSTSAKESKVNHAAVAQALSKRQSFLNKKTRQVMTAGHS
jgi:uncharacterized protein (DUF3084 family)